MWISSPYVHACMAKCLATPPPPSLCPLQLHCITSRTVRTWVVVSTCFTAVQIKSVKTRFGSRLFHGETNLQAGLKIGFAMKQSLAETNVFCLTGSERAPALAGRALSTGSQLCQQFWLTAVQYGVIVVIHCFLLFFWWRQVYQTAHGAHQGWRSWGLFAQSWPAWWIQTNNRHVWWRVLRCTGQVSSGLGTTYCHCVLICKLPLVPLHTVGLLCSPRNAQNSAFWNSEQK